MSSVYRTHTCGQLRPEHVGQKARLSGWVQRKRDHGNLLFIDLMSAHHRGGVDMAEHAVEHASTERVRQLAAAMIRGQQSELNELAEIRARLAAG